MRKLWPLAILIVAGSLGGAQSHRTGIYRLQVSATPRQVPADGKSQARLRIEVKQLRGASAPDGTQVVVHSDIGLLSLGGAGRQQSLTVRTTGGFALLYISSDVAGTATINVQSLDSRSVTYVDFLPEGEAVGPLARVADVTGGWVGYNLDHQLLEARDRATVRFGKLVFECGTMVQIDVEAHVLRAQDVVIRRGDTCLKGEDVTFDFNSKRGVLRRLGDEGPERVFFDSVGLRPLETEWEVSADAFRMDNREADSWLVARSASLFLHEKIVLRNSSLWVQEQKVFAFPPYWIIGLPGYTGATNTQALGMTSSGGLAVDFPFFYRVTDHATGAIRIQHGTRAGSVSSREGWSLAICEEYRGDGGASGSVEFSGLPRRDWGFEWSDSRPIMGDAFSYFNFAMPDHRSIFTDASAYGRLASGRLNVRAYYDHPLDYEQSFGVVGDWLLDPRPLGNHSLSYRLGTSLGMRRYPEDDGVVFVNELYSELSLGERKLSSRTTLLPVFTNIYSWDTGGYHENSLRGDLRLEHRFGASFNVGLDYGVQWRQGGLRDQGIGQELALDLRANHGSKWNSYLGATYDLTSSDVYGYANFDYYLSDKWRTGLMATYLDFDDTPYQDFEVSVGRLFGNREISVNYSTQTRRVYLSLGGFSL